MITAGEIRKWLEHASDDRMIAIDEGGMCLVAVDNPLAYLEVGGVPLVVTPEVEDRVRRMDYHEITTLLGNHSITYSERETTDEVRTALFVALKDGTISGKTICRRSNQMYLGVNAVKKHGIPAVNPGERRPPKKDGHLLVMILDNGLWQVAPVISSDADYLHHYGSYAQGLWCRFSVWYLEERLVSECSDEGRVPSKSR